MRTLYTCALIDSWTRRQLFKRSQWGGYFFSAILLPVQSFGCVKERAPILYYTIIYCVLYYYSSSVYKRLFHDVARHRQSSFYTRIRAHCCPRTVWRSCPDGMCVISTFLPLRTFNPKVYRYTSHRVYLMWIYTQCFFFIIIITERYSFRKIKKKTYVSILFKGHLLFLRQFHIFKTFQSCHYIYLYIIYGKS